MNCSQISRHISASRFSGTMRLLRGYLGGVIICVDLVCAFSSLFLTILTVSEITHAMRHTFATRLLSKTSSHQEIKAVAELLGDDYKVVVKTYLHTDEDGKHNLVDMLND